MLKNPREFGRNANPQFVEETSENVAQISGARVQHVFAREILSAASQRGMTLVMLSYMTQINYQRLTRMLRGSVLMRMSDLGMIANVLPEAFDSVVGPYDPRALYKSISNPDIPTKTRKARIYEAARPMGNPALREPATHQLPAERSGT